MVIGPLALVQARSVLGLEIEDEDHIKLTGDPKKILNDLVLKFTSIFGDTSLDVCKEAINDLTPKPSPDILPELLQP